MKKARLIAPLILGALMIFLGSFMQAGEATIGITGIRSVKGNVVLSVFKNQAEYDEQKPFKQFTFDKKSLTGNKMIVSIKVEGGIYGITMVDDENKNGKIDKNFIGIPKEGFGFSNFLMEKMKKPSFNDFKINLPSAQPVSIRVKYM